MVDRISERQAPVAGDDWALNEYTVVEEFLPNAVNEVGVRRANSATTFRDLLYT